MRTENMRFLCIRFKSHMSSKLLQQRHHIPSKSSSEPLYLKFPRTHEQACTAPPQGQIYFLLDDAPDIYWLQPCLPSAFATLRLGFSGVETEWCKKNIRLLLHSRDLSSRSIPLFDTVTPCCLLGVRRCNCCIRDIQHRNPHPAGYSMCSLELLPACQRHLAIYTW
jgi:hypothetical protein